MPEEWLAPLELRPISDPITWAQLDVLIGEQTPRQSTIKKEYHAGNLGEIRHAKSGREVVFSYAALRAAIVAKWASMESCLPTDYTDVQRFLQLQTVGGVPF